MKKALSIILTTNFFLFPLVTLAQENVQAEETTYDVPIYLFISEQNDLLGLAQVTEDLLAACLVQFTKDTDSYSDPVCFLATHYPNDLYNLASATTTKHILDASGGLIATIEGNGTATSTYYQHPDHLGGSNVTTDENGEVVETTDYYPYGEQRVATGSFDEQRKFIGEEFDESTSLNYLNARYNESLRGQFLSQDPMFWSLPTELLADPQVMNSYNYARNNPIILKDPNGLSPQSAILGAISGLLKTLKGIIDSLANPGKTASGIINTATHPIQSAKSGARSVQSYISSAPNQDARDFRIAETTFMIGAGLIGPKGSKGAGFIDDATLVCRGGLCQADNFIQGKGVTTGSGGKLHGVSVFSSPGATKKELFNMLPGNYSKAGFSTAGDIRALGGEVVHTSGNHFHINGITGQQLESLFTPVVKFNDL